ncbi:glycosyltransferase [Desulfobulbus alkaliphilus]|uniref:glycosyltransferase n=1 Tax=Desulfobulbus alkaliphilus TaxID=869814 RepID=UPI0019654355|nr:glycosyltransferase [Desulfobulbus alkaliphilus]MBM9535783.1 glycosyltransferase [Desulfobulbus alkaliphilus]
MGTCQPDRLPLVVHTDWSRAWGGQEIRILTELREMRKLGFRVALIVPVDSELARRGANEGFPVHTVSSFAKFNLRSWKELLELIRAIQPTVINTHSSEDSWMAGALARLCRVPLIIRTRHVLAPISSSLSYKFFPHLIFTCSDAIAHQLAAQGVPAKKNVVLSTGVDEERFRFSLENRRAVRSRYGIGEHEILVGNVGFLRHYKGHDFIVRTAAAMAAQYRFMIVGGGGELPSLQALTREFSVEDRVIFAGHQEHPEEFFSAFDLFFFSSYEAEGVSQALIQGLLNGLPVLACRIPSTMEPLRHIQDHCLVNYNDVAVACQGLEELQAVPRRDPERMQRQHRIVADLYGLRRMVAILVATYARYGIKVP